MSIQSSKPEHQEEIAMNDKKNAILFSDKLQIHQNDLAKFHFKIEVLIEPHYLQQVVHFLFNR